MDKLDWQKIIQIRSYCEDIEMFMDRFGRDFDTFIEDRAYFNAVAMCVLQIGELANSLSEEDSMADDPRNAQCPCSFLR